MTRKRTLLTAIAAGALVASTTFLSGAPSGAATVEVNCVAADDVQQGSATLTVGANPPAPLATDSQGVLNLIGGQADPVIPPPVSLDNPISGSVDPVSVPPGVSDLELTIQLLLSDTLIDGLVENGVTAIDLSNMTLTATPNAGLSGPAVTVTPGDATINPAAPAYPTATVTESYDVTAGIGDTVSWNLTNAEVGVHITVPPSATVPGTVDMTFGLSCSQTTPGAFISAIVLPPVVAEGPVVEPLSATTPQDTPVDIDLNAGISDGPNPTDLSTLAIIGDPTNGTVTLGANGVATYTPDDGFSGEDTFAYEVCTEPVDLEAPTTTTSSTAPPVDGEAVDAVNGRQGETEVYCNANVVTVTVEADDTPPPTDPTTTTTAPGGAPPATPQGVAGNFTG